MRTTVCGMLPKLLGFSHRLMKKKKDVDQRRRGEGRRGRWGASEVAAGGDAISRLGFSLPTGSQSNREFSTRKTLRAQNLSATNVSRALLRLISVTVFNFTHPPVLSALLLKLSASRFPVPDSPLLVPAPFLSSVHLHGMTFPFLSDRNPL